MGNGLNRLFYVDDSGHPQSGLVVYGWISFEPSKWSGVLGSWIANRKRLVKGFGIPVAKELHMTDYVLGRGRIAQRPPEELVINGNILWRELGPQVAIECLETMSSIEGLQVGAVYRQRDPKRIQQTRRDLYGELLQIFEEQLQNEDSLGMVFMDGDGSDSVYRDSHRALPRAKRRIIEDPVYTDSRTSQLIQMADHVAWCANSSIARIPKHEFAHDWYEKYLAQRDCFNRASKEL